MMPELSSYEGVSWYTDPLMALYKHAEILPNGNVAVEDWLKKGEIVPVRYLLAMMLERSNAGVV